jgi:hypothetical protein
MHRTFAIDAMTDYDGYLERTVLFPKRCNQIIRHNASFDDGRQRMGPRDAHR